MQTIDTHTHLLSRTVKFKRLYDRIAVKLFARNLGMDPEALLADPYQAYVAGLADNVKGSHYVQKSCLFGVDIRYDAKGRVVHSDPTICSDSDEVVRVAQRYPEQFIPFCSVNPRRYDAVDELHRLHEAGCRGAKFLQNYWYVDTNDEKFIPYYEALRDLGLPLIIHLGSEFSVSAKREYEGVDMLRLPLSCGVTVIAAHMALGQIQYYWRPWRNLSRDPATLDKDYFTLLEMLETHDNLYGDIAAILVPLRARALPHLAQQRQIHHKLLFATDYPVPYTVAWNSHGLPRERIARIRQQENPFDRYAEVILQFFPKDHLIYQNYLKLGLM